MNTFTPLPRKDSEGWQHLQTSLSPDERSVLTDEPDIVRHLRTDVPNINSLAYVKRGSELEEWETHRIGITHGSNSRTCLSSSEYTFRNDVDSYDSSKQH
jgi:hypothetical protein